MSTPLWKKSEETISQYLDMLNQLTSTELSEMLKVRPNNSLGSVKVIFSPIFSFFHSFIARRKYKDCVSGFISSVLSAIYSLVSHAKVWEYRMREKERKGLLPPIKNDEIQQYKNRYK